MIEEKYSSELKTDTIGRYKNPFEPPSAKKAIVEVTDEVMPEEEIKKSFDDIDVKVDINKYSIMNRPLSSTNTKNQKSIPAKKKEPVQQKEENIGGWEDSMTDPLIDKINRNLEALEESLDI